MEKNKNVFQVKHGYPQGLLKCLNLLKADVVHHTTVFYLP
jgi:hypothetical protein